MRKVIALFVVFSILAISGNLYAKERRGAELMVDKKDGQQVRGELIAVKQDSLLLLERESGANVSVDIEDISVIKIVKKLKTRKGFNTGFKVGVGLGVGYVLLSAAEGELEGGNSILNVSFKALAWGFLFGLTIGGLSSIDKKIQIEGMTDSEIKEILEKLRSKARIQNYQ